MELGEEAPRGWAARCLGPRSQKECTWRPAGVRGGKVRESPAGDDQAVEGEREKRAGTALRGSCGGRDWAWAVFPGRGEGRVWEPGPLQTHYSFSPQPTAPQPRPGWLSAGHRGCRPGQEEAPVLPGSSLQGPRNAWGSCRLRRQRWPQEEDVLSGHLGPLHPTPPHGSLGNLPLPPSLPLDEASADPASNPAFLPGCRGFLQT